jgi:hypothetical protein
MRKKREEKKRKIEKREDECIAMPHICIGWEDHPVLMFILIPVLGLSTNVTSH